MRLCHLRPGAVPVQTSLNSPRPSHSFNKKQSDFSDLKEFNDYLEEVEDISERMPQPPTTLYRTLVSCFPSCVAAAFNLINSVDVQETEARIKAFQQANAALISKNARQDAVEAARIREQDADDRKKREKARQLAAEREATDAAEREASEKALVARLEKTTDQSEIDRLVKESRLAAQKRRDQASTVSEDFLRLMRPPSPEPASRRQQGRDNELEDAPRDRYYDYSDMFHLGDYLSDPVTALKDPVARARADAGGFRNEAVWERHVRSAVQGLFCRPLDWPAEEVQLAGKA